MRKVLPDCFDREWVLAAWKVYGFDEDTARRATEAYEDWSQESMSLDEIHEAIIGSNDSGGLAPTRQEAFFAGFRYGRGGGDE